MELVTVTVPYHLGREGVVLGAGPPVLADAIGARSIAVERLDPAYNEIYASFDVIRQLAAAVQQKVEAERFPLVLAGNCSSALGTVAGLGRDVGVIWFDGHADFHTPDSTPTGFLDGMALAALTGAAWEQLRRTIPGHRPVPEAHVVLVGARDVDPTERERLERSEITRCDAADLEDALLALQERVNAVYVHVDLDVLDPAEARANDWATEGGPSADELHAAVEAVVRRFAVPAAAFTAYDPRSDRDGRVPAVAASLASLFADVGAAA